MSKKSKQAEDKSYADAVEQAKAEMRITFFAPDSAVYALSSKLDSGSMGIECISVQVYRETLGYLQAGLPIGFLEQWLSDQFNWQSGDCFGMTDEDLVVCELREIILRNDGDHGIFGRFDPNTPDQKRVAEERRQFDEKYPDASNYYRGCYWQLFCQLLDRYLAEREKQRLFDRVEDWVFAEYDRMLESMTDDQLPPVLICRSRESMPLWQPRYRRPSLKDGGRIVKRLMDYITAKQWFGREYVSRTF